MSKAAQIPFPEDAQWQNAGMRGNVRLIRLTAPLIRITSAGIDVIPAGFVSDGCSLPQFSYSLLGHPFGGWLEDAIGHDWDYSVHGRRTRKLADQLFRETLWNRKFPLWKISAIYSALRLGGGKHFKGGRCNFELNCEPGPL
jgi:hypothetical protein